MTSKTRALFLCTGNSARSQMGEAFLRHYASDHFEAYSAGLDPKGMNPLTVTVMSEIGLDISGQTSKSVTEYLGKQLIQVLVTVCDHAEKNCPTTWPGINKKMHWSFEDPAAVEGSEEEKLQKFREVRDQIDEKIQAWLTEQGIDFKK
ncbi:MAG: arsenate reductase ArsC [Anaerolineaceae bacterium]|jgi:arsenate reductase|nr:arsenate reductase ArsC [Anaerolineaceae bacterium]